MRRRSARTTNAASKGTGKGHKTADIHECNWAEGRKTDATCSEICASPGDLFEHVSQEHVSRGPKGFFCKWSECGNRRKVVYITLDSLQKHLKTHIYEDTDHGSTLEDFDDEPSDKSEHDSECDDDDDEEEEEDEEEISPKKEATAASKKRKTKSPVKSKAKIQKVDGAAAKNNKSAASDKSKPSAAAFDPSGFFYRFSCEWNVDASLYGMDTSISRYVKCKRKFKKYPEALDHLCNHHIEKLAAQDDPIFKCSWENCKIEEFSDVDDLKEHVKSHAKGE